MITIIDTDSVAIKMMVDSEYEKHRAETFFTKEPETIDWIKTFQPHDIFFDIGANVGVYTLFARAFHGEAVEVCSFEPAYHNFAKLCQNIEVNNWNDSLVPYCIAFGGETTSGSMHIVSSISGSAQHSIESVFVPDDDVSSFRQGVLIVTLDDFIYTYDAPCPTHIKIDVDGVEEKILKGGQRILGDKRLQSVLVEITDTDDVAERITDIMKSHGLTDASPLNTQQNHSRVRRTEKGNAHIQNIIFSRA